MPVVPDGVYKIFNVQYPTQVAGLVNGGPGPIDGRTDQDAHNDKWEVTNIYPGPDCNEIMIESVTSPETFAYADQAQGASVIGSANPIPIIWTVVKADVGPGGYRIQSPDGVFIWQLPAENTNIVVIPYPPTPGANSTKWTFQPA